MHTSKVQKYDDKDVQIWMTNNNPGEFPPPKVCVTSFVCNWRGVISSKSYSSWHGLGFSRSMLMNLSTVLSGTYACGNITSEKLKNNGGKESDCSRMTFVVHITHARTDFFLNFGCAAVCALCPGILSGPEGGL